MTVSATQPGQPAAPARAPVPVASQPGKVRRNAMEARDLRVAFGGREVIHGIDVPFVRGRVTAILGPSGCGKTTLLRCLNRLTEASRGASVSGRIVLNGKNASSMDPVLLRRRVGMVFQKPNPFPMSIRENVLYGCKAQGMEPSLHADVLESSLRKAVLWDEVKDRLNDSALTLSGGQQQRICIARTLAVSPEVVLMDEPAASLDPTSTLALEDTIARLRGEYTVVFVTHDIAQAQRVSDYIAFMYLGTLVEYGETHQLFDRPRQAATRAYLGGALLGVHGAAEDGSQPSFGELVAIPIAHHGVVEGGAANGVFSNGAGLDRGESGHLGADPEPDHQALASTATHHSNGGTR